MENGYKKEYVAVKAVHGISGSCRPLALKLNDGRQYTIDRLVRCCRADSGRVKGKGMRYTVVIGGRETFLYDEENGKWFVEYKVR